MYRERSTGSILHPGIRFECAWKTRPQIFFGEESASLSYAGVEMASCANTASPKRIEMALEWLQ